MIYSDRHKTFLVDFSLIAPLYKPFLSPVRGLPNSWWLRCSTREDRHSLVTGSVRLCSWGYCSISLTSRERSSAPLLKNTGFHHVFVSFFGEDVRRASSRDFSFRSRGIHMQISFTFFTRCFYSPQHSTAFFPGNQIRLSINSRSSSLANLPPDMHPLTSNLGYALHTMLLYLLKEALSTKSHGLHHKLPHFSPFPQSHKILTTTVLEIRCVFRIRLSSQKKTMLPINHRSKSIEWKKKFEIVSKSPESWR